MIRANRVAAVLSLMLCGSAVSYSRLPEPAIRFFCSEGEVDVAFGDTAAVISFPDRHSVQLFRVRSGSGIRYESPEPRVVFTAEGSDATVEQDGAVTFSSCVAGTVTMDARRGLRSFEDRPRTFRFSYPDTFVLSGGGGGYTRSWRANSSSRGLILARVTVPRGLQGGTNFAGATFTVGVSAEPTAVSACTVAANGERAFGAMSLHDESFAKFALDDAGAGNRYRTTSYRTVRDGECYAVEYTIHFTNLANYDPKQGVTAFDETAVRNALDSIVKSFAFRAGN